ncbi:MAG: hypothetical protein NC308_05085 [Clostridium sp.]|nr:hypothetical protein [Bacteroides sp.]MCM1198243.1 hypothetical protein [Clostridium sp.]
MKNILLSAFAAVMFLTACETQSGDSGRMEKWESPYSLEGLTVDGQFPIIAWTGIEAENAEVKLAAMRDCGINVYLGWYDNMDAVISTLEQAEKAGVKAILKSNELLSDTEQAVKRMMDSPALFGYHIDDEPEVSEFGTLADIVNRIKAVDSGHPCYVNLYPNWAWGAIDGYSAKVTSFLSQVPVRFLSFDHYPIMEVNGVSSLRPEWYKNLEDIRRIARAKKLPVWAFALALSHRLGDVLYPVPTVEELRLQMFSNLVYGAQGFQHFTFWGIWQSGPTQVYDRVKTVNRELQALSKFFLGADVTDVWHVGENIPYGTKKLAELPYGIDGISADGEGVILSRVRNEDNIYLAIVNKDYRKSQSVDIKFTGRAWKFDKEGNRADAVSGPASIAPGDIMVYQIID